MIILKRPVKEYESRATAFKQEFIENGETTINGSELLDLHLMKMTISLVSSIFVMS